MQLWPLQKLAGKGTGLSKIRGNFQFRTSEWSPFRTSPVFLVHFCYCFSFLAIDTTKTSFPKLKNKSLFSNCCLKGSYILGAGRNISMSDISRTVRTCKDCRFCSNEFYVLFFYESAFSERKVESSCFIQAEISFNRCFNRLFWPLVIGGRDDIYIYNLLEDNWYTWYITKIGW